MSRFSTGVIAVSFALLLLVVGLERSCGGGDTPQASEAPGAHGFRSFSAQLNDALHLEGTGFLVGRMEPRYVQCNASDGLDIVGDALCDELGPRFAGFPVTRWEQEFGIQEFGSVSRELERLQEALMVEASDDLWNGGLAVRAVNIDQGSHRYETIVQAIVSDARFEEPERVASGTSWRFFAGRWMMTHILFVPTTPGDVLVPNYQGRTYYPPQLGAVCGRGSAHRK